MLPTFIAIATIATVIVLWTVSTQRRLQVQDENISNTMRQIGVELSSCFDTLLSLLDLTKGYAKQEGDTLIETMKSRRSIISEKSKPDEVMYQEGVVLEVLSRISTIIEQYPDLKSKQSYIKTMDEVKTCVSRARTNRLIYNDCVTKFNRAIRMFPASMIAGMLGFRQREYLVEAADKADMPSMK